MEEKQTIGTLNPLARFLEKAVIQSGMEIFELSEKKENFAKKILMRWPDSSLSRSGKKPRSLEVMHWKNMFF